jgi:hypothetical protein
LHKYLYANGNVLNSSDPSGNMTLPGKLAVAGIIAIAGTILLPSAVAAYQSLVHGKPFVYQAKRNIDNFYAYLPWFIYDDDDLIIPSTPAGVIRNHAASINRDPFGVPAELLATVLLTELRHYNVGDSLFAGPNNSIGIAQIMPDTIIQHMRQRPDLYMPAVPFLSPTSSLKGGLVELLNEPARAIELLALEIRYHAVINGVNLNRWYTSPFDSERAAMIAGFVSAKDEDNYNKWTKFGTHWGPESFELIKKNDLLGKGAGYKTIDTTGF